MMKHYNQNYHEVDYKLLFYFLLASLLLISLGVGNQQGFIEKGNIISNNEQKKKTSYININPQTKVACNSFCTITIQILLFLETQIITYKFFSRKYLRLFYFGRRNQFLLIEHLVYNLEMQAFLTTRVQQFQQETTFKMRSFSASPLICQVQQSNLILRVYFIVQVIRLQHLIDRAFSRPPVAGQPAKSNFKNPR